MDFTGFEKIARHLARPLVLVGFVMTLLFGLHKLIVQSGLLSQVSASESSAIIKLILQYGFWLGLAVMVLGFGLAFFNSWTEKKTLIEVEKPISIKIVREEAAAPLIPAKPTCSSLPHQPFFFGRTNELASVAEAISPEARTWGALIDGPGGIGKTALAIKAGHAAPAAHFERRIFLSAKVRELTPAGEVRLDDFLCQDYPSLLADLAWELGDKAAAKTEPDERAKAVKRALLGKRILLIIDNVEIFPEAERIRLYQFFSRLPEGCKAIVTSRRRTDIDARVIRLDRMEKQDALDLIAALAERNLHLQKADKQERLTLYEISGGNPLLIRWLAGQLGRTGSRCRTVAEAYAFLEDAPKGNDPLEYIFGDLIDTFSESETAVLAALAHFSHPAPVEQIAIGAGIAAPMARTALEDLHNRALLVANEEKEKFLLPKLAAAFIRRQRPKAIAESGDRLTSCAYALALEKGYKNYESFPTLEASWPLLAASLPIFAQGDNDRLQPVCYALERFLQFSGRWDELLSLCQQAENKALVAGDVNNAGWRAYLAGWIFSLRRQAVEVLESAARCDKHWAKSGLRERALAIRLRGLGHKLEENYSEALEACQESLALWQTIAPESDEIVISLNMLAEIERLTGKSAAAEDHYKEALRIAVKVKYSVGIASITGKIAELSLDRGSWLQAEEFSWQALELAEQVGQQELIGATCYYFATALARQGKAAEGVDYARRAVEIFSHLRQPDELEKAQAALRECET